MLLHDHILSQAIGNEKIHWIRYPGCQNQTIFKDFRRWNLKFVLHNLRDYDFSALNLILSHILCSYMIIYRLNQSEIKKYIELGTLNVKIGPFLKNLVLKTQKSQSHKFWSANLRFQGLQSLKMVWYWLWGYLIQCIFSFLIDWDGIWSCRSTGSGPNLKFIANLLFPYWRTVLKLQSRLATPKW